MSELSKRSTVYFDPSIHQALKIRAASTHVSVSELINEAVCLLMSDDQEDLKAFSERVNEPEISYEVLLNDLKNMEKYKVTFKKSVARDLRKIPNQDVARILARIDCLAEEPRAEGCIKLSGQDKYRVRQGVYRIVYEIKDDVLVVQVVKVAHRSNIYKIN